jgi:hypothetical protein
VGGTFASNVISLIKNLNYIKMENIVLLLLFSISLAFSPLCMNLYT